MKHPLPPLELLNHLFELSETSPSGLIWKNPRSNSVKKGSTAGRINSYGYYHVGIRTDKDRNYKTHRIIYYMKTGEDPQNFCIDHISDRGDNFHIRKATSSQNGGNAKKTKRKTTSKYKGVSKNKNRKRWKASLMVNGKTVFSKYFLTEEEAALAYNKKALEYYGEFALLNVIE